MVKNMLGEEVLVATIDIDPVTFAFAKYNLKKTNYKDVILVNADGDLDYAELQPYDRIAFTTMCTKISAP